MKEIPLTRGKVAKVCDCHAHLVEGYKWNALQTQDQKFRAVRSSKRIFGKQHNIYMHVVINNTPKGFHTDHINGDPLDNRCCNLRTATPSENQHNLGKYKNNTSGFKGVSWDDKSHAYRAHIRVSHKLKHLGMFDTAEEAARAYDIAARELHGGFARTNF